MRITELFIIIVMTIIVVLVIKNHYGEVEYVKSTVDQRYYLVRKLPDSLEAANYLAKINQNLFKLTKHMMAKYPHNKDVLQLYKNYDRNVISEGSAESGYTSYSINKGESLILCIRQKDSNKFVDMNVIMYVAIHELAHIMTPDVGHTDNFWKNFRFLLEEAIKLHIYSKEDFNKHPKDYCGIKISNSVI